MRHSSLSKRRQAKANGPKVDQGVPTTAPTSAPATPPAPRDAGVAAPKKNKTSPAKLSQSQLLPADSPVGRLHDLRSGPARGTRSGHQDTVHAFEWEALQLEKHKEKEKEKLKDSPIAPAPAASLPVRPAVTPKSGAKEPDRRITVLKYANMSRNRTRAPPTIRDNGLAATEETEIWTKIMGDLKLAQEKNDQQKTLAEQIRTLNEKITKDGTSKYSPGHFDLWYVFNRYQNRLYTTMMNWTACTAKWRNCRMKREPFSMMNPTTYSRTCSF